MGIAQPPERVRRTAEERREEVLDAAVIEFATHGLYGASTEAIAARAGISQPYVLRLFGTKKALFLASVQRVTNAILDSWAQALRHVDPQAAPGQKLEALGRQYDGFVGEVNALRLVLQSFSSAEDPDVRALSHQSLRSMHAWVSDKTGATPRDVQQFFAYGMMLTVAASIRAADLSATETWARSFVEIPIRDS